MIRKNYYAVARACGDNSPRLIKCNCLAGCRVQLALTRCRGGLSSHNLRQELAPKRGGFKSPESASTRLDTRCTFKRKSTIDEITYRVKY